MVMGLEDVTGESLFTGDGKAYRDQSLAVDGAPVCTLWLMAGFAGAGKTTLARWLVDQLEEEENGRWEVLNRDELKKRRMRLREQEARAGYYAFEELGRLVRQKVIIQGKAVIVDTSNERPFIAENINKMLQQMENHHLQLKLKVILCFANEETRTRRLQARGSAFAPYVQTLPDILDDFQWISRFHHLFASDDAVLEEFENLLNNPAHLEHLQYPVNLKQKAIIVNTNPPFETYAPHVWQEFQRINSFERNKALSAYQ